MSHPTRATRSLIRPAAVVALTMTLASSAPAGDDWPHLRGPAHDGAVPAAPGEGLGLAVAWSVALGPSYSCVSIVGERVVTLASNGTEDFVVALSSADGRELWRHRLGPVYRGHDGSEDGPIASPALADDAAYVIDPRGSLRALDLASGELLWSKEVEGELGGECPEYGFTSSPLVVGELLIAQVGGSAGRALCAFERMSGEPVWSALDGEVAYQSPVVLTLAGRRQLVVLNGPELVGLEPADGAVLWRHALAEGEGASMGLATPVDDERFLVSVRGALRVIRVTASEAGDGYATEETARLRDLGRGYAAPVVYDEHVYGLQGGFLTCVSLESGRRVWKSRPPGGCGLVRRGDRLIVFAADGHVVVVRATPEGYQEEARVRALEFTGYSWPSLAGDRVYVRNSAGLACVGLTEPAPAVATPEATESRSAAAGAFAGFLAELEASDERVALVEARFGEAVELPLVEDGFVHFVYRGEAEDVAVAGSLTDGGTPDPLVHVEGTDLWYRSYPVSAGSRIEYLFHVDFDDWVADPRNPHRTPARWGELEASEVLLPGFERGTKNEEPAEGVARGRLETLEFTSERLENTRQVQLWLPPGYEDAEDAAFPLLIVHQGGDWLEKGRLANTLDNTVGRSVRPLVVAFVEPIDEWWFEGGGSGTEAWLDMLAEEFVPWLSERYELTEKADERALFGVRNFGLTAAYGALRHPDVFGKAAMQSIFLGDIARHGFFELLAGEPRSVEFYLDWNRYEERNKDRGVDFAADNRRTHAALVEAGYTVHGGEAPDCHGWGSWRSRADRMLAALFPPR